MTASNHEAIAKHVWPDASIGVDGTDVFVNDFPEKKETFNRRINLLETDSNGNPTQQAKASALDVLVWLLSEIRKKACDEDAAFIVGGLIAGDDDGNVCEYTYKAACEVLGLEIEDAQ